MAGCHCRAHENKGFDRGCWIVAHSAVAHSDPSCRSRLPMSSVRIQQCIQQTSPLWPIQQPSIQQPSLSPTTTSRGTFARTTERYSQAQRYLEPKWLRTILLCRTLFRFALPRATPGTQSHSRSVTHISLLLDRKLFPDGCAETCSRRGAMSQVDHV